MANEADRAAEQPGDLFAVRATVTPAQAEELLARADLDFGCRPRLRPNRDGSASLDLLAPRVTIDALRAKGHRLEVGENVSASGRARQAEIGRGDRFAGGRTAPHGLGRKHGGSGAPGRGPAEAP